MFCCQRFLKYFDGFQSLLFLSKTFRHSLNILLYSIVFTTQDVPGIAGITTCLANKQEIWLMFTLLKETKFPTSIRIINHRYT